MQLTAEDVKNWFNAAQAGERLTYHEGHSLSVGYRQRCFTSATVALRKLYDDGRVTFCQRRLSGIGFGTSDSRFGYIAVKLKRRADVDYTHGTFREFGLTSAKVIKDAA